MKKSKAVLAVVFCLGLCLTAGAAWAHDLWITCPKAKEGQKLTAVTSLGHDFPKGDAVDPAELEDTYVKADTNKAALTPGPEKTLVTAKPLAAGSYVVAASTKPKYFTKSPAGYVQKTKDQVPEAIKCFRSVKFAKAIVNLGGQAGDVSKTLGQDLEIVPLANPAALKAGAELPVKVLLAGKPLADAEISATYAGFSKGKEKAFTGKTDAKGLAQVKLSHAGLWMVKVGHKTPYKDPAKCDVLSKGSVLTFALK